MPFVVRETQKIDTPTTICDFDDDDKVKFLNDLDLWKDELPQPYRRIDKILQEIVEDAWTIIEQHLIEAEIEAKKPRPSKYENLFQLDNVEDVGCLCASPDDSYIFASVNGGLAAIDAASLSVVDIIHFDNVDNLIPKASRIQCCTIKPSVWMITLCTTSDHLFMYLFISNKLYPVQQIYDIDSDKKIRKFELSENGDYLALLIESKSNVNESLWIEVFKFQKDVWSTQIESVIERSLLNKTGEEAQDESLEDAETRNESSETRNVFTKPIFLCKIKAPVNLAKISPIQNLNIQNNLKLAENSDLIGTGVNHFFSKIHLDARQLLAERRFETEIGDYSALINDAEFKFIYANRLNSTDGSHDVPSNLMVIWSSLNQILFYPFVKLTKELESKYDYCMPFANPIELIETSKNNTLIAVGFKNNNIVVFDTIAGVVRKCVSLNGNFKLKSLHFLPTIKTINLADLNKASFNTKLTTELICLVDDGQVFLIDCTLNNDTKPVPVYTPKYMNSDDKFEIITPCKNLPGLALVTSITNKIYLLDIAKGSLVCELENRKNVQRLKVNEMSFACKNEMLFLKYRDNATGETKLYAHTLKLISKLGNYFAQSENLSYSNEYIPSYPVGERMKMILNQRISEQFYRKDRINDFWSSLKDQKNQ